MIIIASNRTWTPGLHNLADWVWAMVWLLAILLVVLLIVLGLLWLRARNNMTR